MKTLLKKIFPPLLFFGCNSRDKFDAQSSEFVLEPLPTPAGTSGVSVRSIRGTGPDDVWVVASTTREGRSSRERYTQCYHWNGSAWSLVECPARITAIAPAAKNDVWAVGRYGTVAHFDGRSWREERLEVGWDLLAAVAAGTQVWAVASGPEIYHFDGTRWEVLKPEDLADNRVQEIFAAGGQVFAPASRGGTAMIVRYDGKEWRREVVGQGGVVRIAGTGPDDLWALSAKADAYHFDGRNWRLTPRPTGDRVIDGWAASPSELWVVGEDGMVQTWDGQAWKAAASGTHARLWSVWAAPGGPVFVGGDIGLLRRK